MSPKPLTSVVPSQYQKTLVQASKLAGMTPQEMAALYMQEFGGWSTNAVPQSFPASVSSQGVTAGNISVGPQGVTAPGVSVSSQGVTTPNASVTPQGITTPQGAVPAGTPQGQAPATPQQVPHRSYYQALGQNLFRDFMKRPFNSGSVDDQLMMRGVLFDHIRKSTPAQNTNDVLSHYNFGPNFQSSINDFSTAVQDRASQYTF